MDEMKEALMRHKKRGLDITILLGGAEPLNSDKPIAEEEDKGDEELAPDSPDVAKDGEGEEAVDAMTPEKMMAFREMLGGHGMSPLKKHAGKMLDERVGVMGKKV